MSMTRIPTWQLFYEANGTMSYGIVWFGYLRKKCDRRDFRRIESGFRGLSRRFQGFSGKFWPFNTRAVVKSIKLIEAPCNATETPWKLLDRSWIPQRSVGTLLKSFEILWKVHGTPWSTPGTIMKFTEDPRNTPETSGDLLEPPCNSHGAHETVWTPYRTPLKPYGMTLGLSEIP